MLCQNSAHTWYGKLSTGFEQPFRCFKCFDEVCILADTEIYFKIKKRNSRTFSFYSHVPHTSLLPLTLRWEYISYQSI